MRIDGETLCPYIKLVNPSEDKTRTNTPDPTKLELGSQVTPLAAVWQPQPSGLFLRVPDPHYPLLLSSRVVKVDSRKGGRKKGKAHSGQAVVAVATHVHSLVFTSKCGSAHCMLTDTQKPLARFFAYTKPITSLQSSTHAKTMHMC